MSFGSGRHRLASICFLAPIVLSSLVAIVKDSSAQQTSGSSESSSKAHQTPSHAQAATPEPGSVSNGVYRNSFFGFRYKVPFGWVDRTQEMGEGGEPGKAIVLLAMFERPPQAAGETVNSAVIIAAESVASYPGLKNAADYFGPLTELTTSKGFKAANQPYEFSMGGKPLVRGDFSKDLGPVKMLQSTLVSAQRGYVLSFTFIAGDEDEVEKLVDGLSFAGAKARTSGQSPRPH